MHVLQQVLLVAVGGAVGALCRFGTASWLVKHLGSSFPWATLSVNVVGCLVIGRFLSSGLAQQEHWRLAVAVGFLGSFTTYSAFGAETIHLLRFGKHGAAMAYVGASLVLGLAAVWIGWKLGSPAAGT